MTITPRETDCARGCAAMWYQMEDNALSTSHQYITLRLEIRHIETLIRKQLSDPLWESRQNLRLRARPKVSVLWHEDALLKMVSVHRLNHVFIIFLGLHESASFLTSGLPFHSGKPQQFSREETVRNLSQRLGPINDTWTFWRLLSLSR